MNNKEEAAVIRNCGFFTVREEVRLKVWLGNLNNERYFMAAKYSNVYS